MCGILTSSAIGKGAKMGLEMRFERMKTICALSILSEEFGSSYRQSKANPRLLNTSNYQVLLYMPPFGRNFGGGYGEPTVSNVTHISI